MTSPLVPLLSARSKAAALSLNHVWAESCALSHFLGVMEKLWEVFLEKEKWGWYCCRCPRFKCKYVENKHKCVGFCENATMY